MSRGLGKLQRQILEHLEDPLPIAPESGVSETTLYSAECILGNGVYDLRWVSKKVLRERTNAQDVTWLGLTVERYGERTRAYDAAFSRAVKGLLKRRILWPVVSVPVSVQWRKRKNSHVTNDYEIQWWSRQVRFVKLGSAHPKFKTPKR